MTGFASMSERHAFGLEAVAEMTGKLLQAAYLRASRPGDPDDQDRAILLFDRLARGFRLTLALESRLDRDRRREAAGLDAPAADTPSASLPSPTANARAPRPPREDDCERDADLEAADLSDHVRDLRRVVADDADILDPDGAHAETLDRWAGVWGDVVYARVRPGDGPDDVPQEGPRRQAVPEESAPSKPLSASVSAPRRARRRASG